MGYICDFCRDQRSFVYCRADAACLCLSCDRNVHSANALSRRHSRTLVCERCNSQPAFVRCADEKISLCQNCDWSGHVASNDSSNSSHKRQAVSCYSGCPSAAELSNIWSFLFNIPSLGENNCEFGMSSMSISDNNNQIGNLWDPDKSNVWVRSSDSKPVGSTCSRSSELARKGPGQCADDELYENFNMDEVDIGIENYEELFGTAFDNSQQLFENNGIDGLFRVKDMSGPDSNCQGACLAEEGSSVGPVGAMQPVFSNAASVNSMISCKTEPNICFRRQGHSTLSFSGVTGESSGGDYQDCSSSMLLMGEPPWCSQAAETSLPSGSRSSAVLRYKEKKKTRK